jgi:hypothetical protein
MDEKSISSQKKPACKKLNVEKMNKSHNSNSDNLREIKKTPLNSKTVTKMLLFSIPSVEMISRRKLLRTLSCQGKQIQLIFSSLAHFIMQKLARIIGL